VSGQQCQKAMTKNAGDPGTLGWPKPKPKPATETHSSEFRSHSENYILNIRTSFKI